MQILKYNQIFEAKNYSQIKDLMDDMFIEYLDNGKLIVSKIRLIGYGNIKDDGIWKIRTSHVIEGDKEIFEYYCEIEEEISSEDLEYYTKNISSSFVLCGYELGINSKLIAGKKESLTKIKIHVADTKKSFYYNEKIKEYINKLSKIGFRNYDKSKKQITLYKEIFPVVKNNPLIKKMSGGYFTVNYLNIKQESFIRNVMKTELREEVIKITDIVTELKTKSLRGGSYISNMYLYMGSQIDGNNKVNVTFTEPRDVITQNGETKVKMKIYVTFYLDI
jgi:hypothetical protein